MEKRITGHTELIGLMAYPIRQIFNKIVNYGTKHS